MTQLKIPLDESKIRIGDFKEQSGYDAMRDLLGSDSGITAVYVSSSKMTYGAVRAILESGRDIPGDISVVGFDVHDPSGGLMRPGITTVIQQESGIGKIACQLLLDRINQPEGRVNRKILLQPEFLIKESCRAI
jgi:DNA-binding LacI/PurR family transcriptional regulator